MKILLFGGAGQLGREVEQRGRDLNFEIISPVISEIDISEETQVRFLASKVKPDIIINCAAYTAVDKAEEEPEAAWRTNTLGARNAALAAADIGKRLIHISTDYVFRGDGSKPLKETDPVDPQSVYGKTKLEGETEVQNILKENGLIVRTSSLHGKYGANFVHTMLKLFRERKPVRVVNDQWMSPTWAGYLAEVLLDLSRIPCHGVVHVACGGITSWFDFASAIRDAAFPLGDENLEGEQPLLESQSIKDLTRPAPRPTYSAFDLTRLTGLLGRTPLSWENGLREHLKEIGEYRLKNTA